jgi:hypothetical protein
VVLPCTGLSHRNIKAFFRMMGSPVIHTSYFDMSSAAAAGEGLPAAGEGELVCCPWTVVVSKIALQTEIRFFIRFDFARGVET